jgi:hypothetical protein
LTQIESKLNEVKAGRAPEYTQPLEELQVCGGSRSKAVPIGSLIQMYLGLNSSAVLIEIEITSSEISIVTGIK